MLCQLGYTAENDGPTAVKQIQDGLSKMPAPEGTVKGAWRVGWGPAVPTDNSNSNLMYAAELVDTSTDPAVPVFTAVVIRGTDTQAKPSGVIKQIIQDLNAANQVSLPFPNTDASAKIAQGSELGFTILQGFVDSGKNLEQYVKEFLGNNTGAPVVVTGHSLGGCLTTVMALNLALQNPGAVIVPNTFAAPTAGNQAFIDLYQQKCDFSPRWVNPFDLVPKAFANLSDIKGLWTMCSRPAPLLVKIAVEGLQLVLDHAHATYQQQSNDQSRLLKAGCQSGQRSATSADVQNQAVQEIKALLQKAMQDHLAQGRIADIARNLEADIGNTPVGKALNGVASHLIPQKLVEQTLQHLTLEDLTGWVQELLFQHSVLTGYWNAVHDFPNVAPIPNPFDQAQAAAGNH